MKSIILCLMIMELKPSKDSVFITITQRSGKTKLRSEIGCIIEEKDLSKVADIKENLQIKTFPEKSYIIAEFPNKGKLSIIFGIIKVYSAMDKFVKEKGYKKEGAVMEIYDVPNKKIIYRKEIVE